MRIESIEAWVEWAAEHEGLSKTQAVEKAAHITGITTTTIWAWLNGTRNAKEAPIRLLHLYAVPNDFYWLPNK